MNRRTTRLRREYLYRKSLEGAQREEYEKKRAIREALQEGKPVPTELRKEANQLKKQVDLEDDNTAVQRTHIDDEYGDMGVADPQVRCNACTTGAEDASLPFITPSPTAAVSRGACASHVLRPRTGGLHDCDGASVGKRRLQHLPSLRAGAGHHQQGPQQQPDGLRQGGGAHHTGRASPEQGHHDSLTAGRKLPVFQCHRRRHSARAPVRTLLIALLLCAGAVAVPRAGR